MRDGDGLEVLVGRRADHIRAFPGATAFPGGKIEPQDREWSGAGDDPGLAARHAALREAFEETGLLLCSAGEGPPAGANVVEARAAVEGGSLPLPQLLADWDRRLDPDRLTPFARWVTPADRPYRFDTWFFLAAASPYEAAADLVCAEFERLWWASPAALLEDVAINLPHPTRRSLERLRDSPSVAEALSEATRNGLYDARAVGAPAP